MLTLRMISDLPDFERTFPTPPVSSVGGGGMRPCGVWFVGFRRRRGAAGHAPAQTRADRGGRPSGVILHGSGIARNVKGSVSGARPCLVQRAKMRPRIVEGAIDHACDQRHVANRVPV